MNEPKGINKVKLECLDWQGTEGVDWMHVGSDKRWDSAACKWNKSMKYI